MKIKFYLGNKLVLDFIGESGRVPRLGDEVYLDHLYLVERVQWNYDADPYDVYVYLVPMPSEYIRAHFA